MQQSHARSPFFQSVVGMGLVFIAVLAVGLTGSSAAKKDKKEKDKD